MVIRRWWGPTLGLAIGLLAALYLWPSTGWLVRSQMRLLIPTTSAAAAWAPVPIDRQTPAFSQAKEDFSRLAAKEGDSYKAKLAAVLLTATPIADATDEGYKLRLRALANQYPDLPIFRAALLRLSTRWQVRINRPEIRWVTGEDRNESTKGENTPQNLREFEADAAIGERLDPTNAFFPYLRAVGQFAGGHDSEGLESLGRAATKPIWNDYVSDELEVELDLYRMTFGTVSGLPRRAIAAAIVLPHLSQIQRAARLATALAGQRELKGQTDGGLAIRLSVLNCAKLIRTQSTQLIGNLVGRSMSFAATTRPGGALPGVRPQSTSPEAWNVQRLDLLKRYLRSIRHPEAIPVFDRELNSAELLHGLMLQLRKVDFEEAVWKAGIGWIAGLALLSAAIWFAILRAFGALIRRAPQFRANALSGFAPIFSLVFCLAVSWQSYRTIGPVGELTWGFIGDGEVGLARLLPVLSIAIGVVIPLLALLIVAVIALKRKVPVVLFAAEILKRWAVPSIAVLLIAYGLLIPFTVRQEAALNAAVDGIVKHEGKFLASGIGAKWPN